MPATTKLAIAISFLALACGGGGGTDAGTDAGQTDAGPMDAGPDGGPPPIDGGPDGGPPPTFTARLVNNIPGYADLDVCMWNSFGGTLVEAPVWLTQTQAVPFRGVSSYVTNEFFVAVDGLDFVVALYQRADLGAPPACPQNPDDAGSPTPVLRDTITSDQLAANRTYSVIATGLATGTLGAAAGELPSICGATFDQACDAALATRLAVVEDDLSEPAADMARLRVSNQVANMPGFTVCYDPGLAPNTTPGMEGNCVDNTPPSGPADPSDQVALAADVAFGDVTTPMERMPILPTAGVAGGGLYLVPSTAPVDCPPLVGLPSQRCYPILPAFPTPPPSVNIQPNLEAGDVSTIFISGAFGLTGPAAPFSTSFFVWQDNFVAP